MSDSGADTGPVPAEYLRTINIHGRDFQKYSVDHSVHLVPVDEEETDRLELQHRVLDTVFDGRIIFPPVTNVRDVLDCGYGAASWAIEVAETYPQCTVVGVDISPHMKPDDHPGNFDPQLDDINRPFTFSSNKFDVVHSRLVGNGINRTRWPTYLRDIKRVLKPGGWVQLVECYFMCQSDNGSITEAHALRQWSNNYIRSIDGIKNPRAPMQLQAMLHTAGFVSLETTTIQWPLCGWSNDARQRQIGNSNKENIRQLLKTLAVFPFTRRLGMSIDDVDRLVDRARVDAANPSLKPYFPL